MKAPKRRTIALALVLVALATVAVRFISFPARPISNAISRVLGRSVTLSRASLRLLPQPGIELENVAIGEDPAFGAEPMMTAPVVIATLRFSSLWRRRLEFGSISFQESGGVAPSFNLVRRADGEWNIESLMARAGSTPATPTPTRHSEARPHFPYIEMTSGRVNFKAGMEKKVVALTDADFALWMASDRDWRARLKAHPIRTDANLSDTGTVEVEGLIRRDDDQGGSPWVQLQARLRDSQLGQLSALIYGRDRGWRGATAAEINIAGTLPHPAVELHAVVDDFRRYDIVVSQPLRLEATCDAQLDSELESLEEIRCTAPYGDGHIELTGSMTGLAERSYDLALQLQDVPVSRMVALLRRAKRDLPDDLAAEGSVDAQLTASRGSRFQAGDWTGHADLRKLVLRSGSSQLRFPGVGIAIGNETGAGFLLTAEPFSIDLGSEEPATVAARFDSAGYQASVAGPAAIEEIVRAARLVGMRAPTYSVRGSANVQLKIAGAWAGFAPPAITGTARISNTSAEIVGVSVPLRIASAQLELSESTATLRNMVASFGVAGPAFSGTIEIPRACAHPENCAAQFDLRAGELNASALNQLMTAHAQPWYRTLLGETSTAPFLMRARAVGVVTIVRFTAGAVAAANVQSKATLGGGILHFDDLRAQVFGGRHIGSWVADFTGPHPRYSGEGRLQGVTATEFAKGQSSCSGTVDLSYSVSFAGKTRGEILKSAAAEGDFLWSNGGFNRVFLPLAVGGKSVANGFLRFSEFRGHANLKDGLVELSRSRIAAFPGIYEISGTVGLDQRISLSMVSKTLRYNLGGTLDLPEIDTEANRASAAEPAAPASTPVVAPPPKTGPGAN